jgi:flagellar biogenesis protein FliO
MAHLVRTIAAVALVAFVSASAIARTQDVGPEPLPQRASLESRPLGPAPATSADQANTPAASPGGTTIGFTRTALATAAVLAIIVVLALIARKVAQGQGGLAGSLGAGGRAPSGVLQVLGRFPVARGTTLVLLRVDTRVLLLCQTAGKGLAGSSMTTLSEFTDPDEVASLLIKTRDDEGESMARRFQAALAGAERDASVLLGDTVDLTTAKPRLETDAQGRHVRLAARPPSEPARPAPRAKAGARREFSA